METKELVAFTVIQYESTLVSDVLIINKEDKVYSFEKSLFKDVGDQNIYSDDVTKIKEWESLPFKDKLLYAIEMELDLSEVGDYEYLLIIKELTGDMKEYRVDLLLLVHSPYWHNLDENSPISTLIDFQEWFEEEGRKSDNGKGGYAWWIKYEMPDFLPCFE